MRTRTIHFRRERCGLSKERKSFTPCLGHAAGQEGMPTHRAIARVLDRSNVTRGGEWSLQTLPRLQVTQTPRLKPKQRFGWDRGGHVSMPQVAPPPGIHRPPPGNSGSTDNRNVGSPDSSAGISSKQSLGL